MGEKATWGKVLMGARNFMMSCLNYSQNLKIRRRGHLSHQQLSGNKNVFLRGFLNFVWERQRSQRAAFAIFIPFDQQ